MQNFSILKFWCFSKLVCVLLGWKPEERFLVRQVFLGHSPFGLVDVNKYMEGSGISEIGICLHLRKLIRMSDPGLDWLQSLKQFFINMSLSYTWSQSNSDGSVPVLKTIFHQCVIIIYL